MDLCIENAAALKFFIAAMWVFVLGCWLTYLGLTEAGTKWHAGVAPFLVSGALVAIGIYAMRRD